VAYILNPLNSKKVTHRLFSGLVDALDTQEGLASGSGVRLVLSTMLRREDNSMKLQRVSAAEFIKPVISLLDVNNMKEILKARIIRKNVFGSMIAQSEFWDLQITLLDFSWSSAVKIDFFANLRIFSL
jgi:hypothetical protein